MTEFGYARVSVREPENKNLDLQIELLIRAGVPLKNVYSEEGSGSKDDRAELLKVLELVKPGDTLVVCYIDRLSRGLTYGLGIIEGLHSRGIGFRSLNEDMDTTTPNGKLQLAMVLAFSQWYRDSIRDRSIAGQAKARAEGRLPGRRPSLTEAQKSLVSQFSGEGYSHRNIAAKMGIKRGVVALALKEAKA